MDFIEWEKDFYYVEGDLVSFGGSNYAYSYRLIGDVEENSINRQPYDGSPHWLPIHDIHSENKKLKTKCQEQSELIQKLEGRIHGQRVALRSNWEIVEQRAKSRTQYTKPLWFKKVMEQGKVIAALRNKLAKK